MRQLNLMLLLLTFTILLNACMPKTITKGAAYPNMYDEKPLSILVLPPINESTAADAKEYYSTTIAEPLSLKGFYVYPIEVVTDILKYEGYPDTELLVDVPPQKFKEYFGADAVMFTKITKWDTKYLVIGGNVTVGIEFLLKSTETGNLLWKYNDTLVVDTSGSNNSNAGIAGLLLMVLETAVKTSTTDYVPIAKQVNYMSLSTIPLGQYHPQHDQDREMKVVMEKKVKEKETGSE